MQNTPSRLFITASEILNTALKIYKNVKSKYEESGNNKGVAVVLDAIGMVHQDQGNYEEAVKHYNQSLKMKEELRDKSGIATTLHQLGMIHQDQLGMIHQDQGNYEEAVETYNQSLKIEEELGDKSGIAHNTAPAWNDSSGSGQLRRSSGKV